MNSLEFHCRHKYAGGFELDAAFQAGHGVTSLFGPSASGKTSVLAMISGFVSPQSGRIHLPESGKTLVDTTRGICLPAEQRGVGFIFQDHLLFPHLSVEGNLRYGERRGAKRHSVNLARVVEVMELTSLLKRYPRHLSGGESQRVAIGRALMSGPELLLMDEPLAALDQSLKSRILGYVERVVQEWKIPTLFVSHSQADVRRLAGSVVVMDRGRVLAQGTPDATFGTAELLSATSLPAPMNLLRIEEIKDLEGQWKGRVGDQWLWLPASARSQALPLYVQFSPRDVTVYLHDMAGVSARNHLTGIVRQVVPTPEGVFIAVDVGQIVWAEVTAAAVAELDICAASRVTCLIKTSSLRPSE